MGEPTQAEIASELALAIHDVAHALKTSAWALVYLTGDPAELLHSRLSGVVDIAYDIADELRHFPPGAMYNERFALASAGYIAEAVSEAAEGLKTVAWVAVRLGGGEDARPLMEPLAEAAVRASKLSRELRHRLIIPPGEEVK